MAPRLHPGMEQFLVNCVTASAVGREARMASNEAKAQVSAASGEAGRFLALDGLRGVAAFAVILDHVSSATLRAWFPGRYLAVDFFFVLSGFVLAYAYGKGLEQGTLSAWRFMRIRLIRFYPLYLLGLGLGLLLPILAAIRGWEGASPLSQIPVIAAFSLLFLPAPPIYGWTSQHIFPFNGPSWTLFFELVANFAYALVAKFLSWRVFAIVLPVGAALVAVTVMGSDGTGPGFRWPDFDAGLARVLYGFFAGVAIYRLRDVVRLPSMPAWGAVLALLAVFAVPASGLWRQGFDAFAAILLMPLLVAFASGAKVSDRAARLCGALGLLSYGVYALHVPVMILVNFVQDVLGVSLPYGFLNVVLVAGITAIIAALATRFYDVPFRRLLNGRAKRAPKPVPAGEAG
jgi:peptidoglycan/LPS O-acetylase OafA/YrhL